MMENPAWFLYGPGSAKIQDGPISETLNDHEVKVQIKYVGVCGSDVHFWKHGGFARTVSHEKPLIMGHEASGVVASIGAAVTSVKIGDKVAIEPGFPCRKCQPCKTGAYNLCDDMKFAAAPPNVHGCLSKYFVAPEDFVYAVSDKVSLQEAVLVEPMSVAVHSARLANITYGQSVVIMGSGTVGLICAAVAKAYGAQRIMLVDILQKKLDFATQFIECDTFMPDPKASPQDNAARLLESAGISGGVDVVIEASGAEKPVQIGIFALRRGGSFVQTGVGQDFMSVPMLALSQKELRVRGCFRYGPGDYQIALSMIEKGQANVGALISSITPFADAPKAWEKTSLGEGIKNLIQGVEEANE